MRVKCAVDKSGKVHVFERDAQFPFFKQYRLHLLSDCLMISRVSYTALPFSETLTETLTFSETFALSAVRVVNSEHSEKQFVLYTPGSVLVFEFERADQMGEWCDVVNGAIGSAPKLILPNVYVKLSGTKI